MYAVGKYKEEVGFFLSFLRIKIPLGRADSSIIDIQISDPKGNSHHMSKPFEK